MLQVLVTQSLGDEALAPLLRPLADVVVDIDSRVAGLEKEELCRNLGDAVIRRRAVLACW